MVDPQEHEGVAEAAHRNPSKVDTLAETLPTDASLWEESPDEIGGPAPVIDGMDMATCIAYVEHPVTGGMDMAIAGTQFEECNTSHLDTLTEHNRVGDVCPPTLFYAPDVRVVEVAPVVEVVASV